MTLHWLLYSVMKLYWHRPLANPATHVHRYACTDTELLLELPAELKPEPEPEPEAKLDDVAVESAHVAPFIHGLLAHSSTSVVQFCPVYPRRHVQLYAPALSIFVQVAPLLHGALSHPYVFWLTPKTAKVPPAPHVTFGAPLLPAAALSAPREDTVTLPEPGVWTLTPTAAHCAAVLAAQLFSVTPETAKPMAMLRIRWL
jgi:hypothetical protein